MIVLQTECASGSARAARLAKPQQQAAMASAELRTLHVANLTRNVRAAHLKEICGASCRPHSACPRSSRSHATPFAPAPRFHPAEFWGPVSRVHLAVDSRAGLPRGFAYVEFSSPADADDCCVNLDGGKLDGNTITLTLTHDDFPSDAPGAGAGAGGGSEHRSAAPAPWGGEDRRSGGGGGGWDRERDAGRDERRREEGGRGGGGGGSGRRSRSRSRSRERGERGRR